MSFRTGLPITPKSPGPRANIAVFSALFLAALTVAGPVPGPSAQESGLLKLERAGDPYGAGRGSLYFRKADTEEIYTAPQVATSFHLDVGGIVARARVKQTFVNPTAHWLDGTYVFPLPENAAVDALKLKAGDREIVGVIKKKEIARTDYEAARAAGKKAALLESERPNVFVASVANIAPGSNVDISFEYQQKLRYDQGAFSLRIPLVVAPRYHPESDKTVEDESRLKPTIVRQQQGSPDSIPVIVDDGIKTNPVDIHIALTPGFPIGELKSPYHEIHLTPLPGGGHQISLKKKVVPADRNFELRWRPESGFEPTLGLLAEQRNARHYVMAFVMPPTLEAQMEFKPREVVFVIDTSGSMNGNSMEQAKEALTLAVERLRPVDRFNVIRFHSYTGALFHAPKNATPEIKKMAAEAVSSLRAGGGTEMAPAIELALFAPASGDYLRQVIFITDGAVDNEKALFRLVRQLLGSSRLFTVGIGSAPNSYFMRKSAEIGRGTFTHIGKQSEVGERMEALFRKIETPLLTNLQVDWPAGLKVDPSRTTLNDLYSGEPVVVSARLSDVKGNVVVHGCLAGKPWRRGIPLSAAQTVPGVSKVWGQSKIDNLLTDGLMLDPLGSAGGTDPVADNRRRVVSLALDLGLVTEYTSLVAIDKSASKPNSEISVQQHVPLNLPHGRKAGQAIHSARLMSPSASQPVAAQTAPSYASSSIAPPTPGTGISASALHSGSSARSYSRYVPENHDTGPWIPAGEIEKAGPDDGVKPASTLECS